jgi:hypothetical protein
MLVAAVPAHRWEINIRVDFPLVRIFSKASFESHL